MSEETLQEAAALYREHGSISAAARAAGMPRNTMQNRVHRAAERGLLGTDPVMPGFRVAKASTTHDADGAIVRRHIQQLPERGDAFSPPIGHVVKGVSALLDSEGREIVKWVKTREGNEPVDVIEACKAAMEGYRSDRPPTPAPVLASDNLLTMFPANDWHLGMHAWGRETEANWDLKIAEESIGRAAVEAIERSPASVEAVLLGGGDLMHSDNNENRTARSGNTLQVDGRYQKVIGVACRLKVRVIDAMLARHSRVTVRILPGNHDEHAAVAIAYFLAAWYRNEPRVTVDLDPSLFWWHRFGKVLLGATHGHTVKIQQMPGIMAHRRPEDWGATRYRYAHGFHLHHTAKFATEGEGVISEIHQAPIPQDAWHFGSGFLSGRSLQTITYHRDFGEISRSRVAILDA
jgi:hypothetical protein